MRVLLRRPREWSSLQSRVDSGPEDRGPIGASHLRSEWKSIGPQLGHKALSEDTLDCHGLGKGLQYLVERG